MFDFSIVTQWIHSMLTSFMPEGLAVFIECVAIGVCIMLAYAVIAIIMIFMERKVCAAFQCRLGPMRVGPWGTIQVFADVFKMLIKEIITIRHADNFLYNLANTYLPSFHRKAVCVAHFSAKAASLTKAPVNINLSPFHRKGPFLTHLSACPAADTVYPPKHYLL